jgi:hypothetical protein
MYCANSSAIDAAASTLLIPAFSTSDSGLPMPTRGTALLLTDPGVTHPEAERS